MGPEKKPSVGGSAQGRRSNIQQHGGTPPCIILCRAPAAHARPARGPCRAPPARPPLLLEPDPRSLGVDGPEGVADVVARVLYDHDDP